MYSLNTQSDLATQSASNNTCATVVKTRDKVYHCSACLASTILRSLRTLITASFNFHNILLTSTSSKISKTSWSQSCIAMEILSSFGIVLVSVTTLVCLIHSKIVMSKVPQSIPWAGLRNEVLSKTRACLREFTAGFRTLKIGYNQVSESLSRSWLC